MYLQRAKALFEELRGRCVGGWTIQDFLNHGKSAAVFRAARDGYDGALKVFDAELVAQYGELTQLTRIERELSLCDHEHDHLIRIYDGGKCTDTGYLFVAMQRIEGVPLSHALDLIPRDQIPRIMAQIASAAKFLEDQTIAHRDIKPDNVMYSPDTGKATLLDLGVIRPIYSASSPTDDDRERPFIGTLQYSPPEFLLRIEEDSLHGWRAVTFYQLGAVLHDLIERHPIFSNRVSPYARLVNAIQQDTPSFRATDVPQELILLAQNCLVKGWQTRLRLVDWDNFDLYLPSRSTGEAAKQRLLSQHLESLPHYQEWRDDWEAERQFSNLVERLQTSIRQWFVGQEFLPAVEIRREPIFDQGMATFEMLLRSELSPRLRSNLNIRLEVAMLDIRELAVELRLGICLTPEIWISEYTHYTAIYTGVYHEHAIMSAWENSFLPVYELATNQNTAMGEIDVGQITEQDREK